MRTYEPDKGAIEALFGVDQLKKASARTSRTSLAGRAPQLTKTPGGRRGGGGGGASASGGGEGAEVVSLLSTKRAQHIRTCCHRCSNPLGGRAVPSAGIV